MHLSLHKRQSSPVLSFHIHLERRTAYCHAISNCWPEGAEMAPLHWRMVAGRTRRDPYDSWLRSCQLGGSSEVDSESRDRE